MDVEAAVKTLRQGQTPAFPTEAKKFAFAEKLDAEDELRHLREQFNIPTKSSLRRKALGCRLIEPSNLDFPTEADGRQQQRRMATHLRNRAMSPPSIS
jgi:kynureninase